MSCYAGFVRWESSGSFDFANDGHAVGMSLPPANMSPGTARKRSPPPAESMVRASIGLAEQLVIVVACSRALAGEAERRPRRGVLFERCVRPWTSSMTAQCVAWRRDDNEVRPHSAISNKPPISRSNGQHIRLAAAGRSGVTDSSAVQELARTAPISDPGWMEAGGVTSPEATV
jgi:hypothetical protein